MVFKVEQLGYNYNSCANQQNQMMAGNDPNSVGQPTLVIMPQTMQNGGTEQQQQQQHQQQQQSSLSPSNPHKRIKRQPMSSISSDEVESAAGDEAQEGLSSQTLSTNQAPPHSYYGKSPSNNSLSSQSSGWQPDHIQHNAMDHGKSVCAILCICLILGVHVCVCVFVCGSCGLFINLSYSYLLSHIYIDDTSQCFSNLLPPYTIFT